MLLLAPLQENKPGGTSVPEILLPQIQHHDDPQLRGPVAKPVLVLLPQFFQHGRFQKLPAIRDS